jgi:hypothetical protein
MRGAEVTTLQVLPGSDDLFGGYRVVLKNIPAVTVQEMEFPGAIDSARWIRHAKA